MPKEIGLDKGQKLKHSFLNCSLCSKRFTLTKLVQGSENGSLEPREIILDEEKV